MRVTHTQLMTVDGEQAAAMLENYAYDRQRKVNKSTVRYYADQIRRGQWLPGSEIVVGFVPNGDGQIHGKLVNGQHRLWAVIEAESPVEFLVKHYACVDETELGTLYYLTDTQKSRSVSDAYRTMYLQEELGLPHTQLNALGATVFFIHVGFRKAGKYDLSLEQRLQLIRHYGEVAGKYFEIITGCSNYMHNLAHRTATMGVGLITLDESVHVFGQERVESFWRGVMLDDGLRIGDPRKAANTHLLTSTLASANLGAGRKRVSKEYSARYLANCFNAFVEGREIQFTKVLDALAPITIAGSKFTGK